MVPLVYGFIQKDLVISMMAAVTGSPDPLKALNAKQALVFTMASTYQVPCIIAFAAMVREFGLRRALIMLVALDLVGLIVSAAYAHIPLPL
jgi:ferrous iron transport protein B